MDAQKYDELHGSDNWAGLLDPLDLDLRNLLIGYGDLSSAAERAFNNDEGSFYNGYCYYGKSSFFKGVMLPWADSKYQVTSFFYATAQAKFIPASREDSEFESNWMGYVAVSNDEYSKSIGRREICVVWRGTTRTLEWIDDIAGVEPVSAEPLLPGTNSTGEPIKDPTDTPQVMGGWLTMYTTSDPNSEFIPSSARTQLWEHIKELLLKYKDEKVSLTCSGHSLGACLAVLSAFDIARNVVTPNINVSAFIFACPQVGNQCFKEKMEELPNLKVLRVKNDPDIIPFWPSKILKWVSDNVWESVPSELQEYVDVGVEILIDSKKSPYLKEESKLNDLVHPFVYHNLQGMLHTLSGWNGKNGDFDWGIVKRSLGWVNMSNDLLKKVFKVPTNWWVEKNKGMVLNDHGDWVLSPLDRHDHDLPV
ncbi:phospholipase A1-IIdelta-like [Bidens hawaiensis]|uniref:phospholipase A1-IIdelta-like n=1 Tax=Bidens hawaiensis TaxID=980011 RepID=UPI004049D432